MRLARPIRGGLFTLLALISTVLPLTPLLTERVEAASTYSYFSADSDVCPVDDGQSDETLAVRETQQSNSSNSSLTYFWCLKPGSTYEFSRSGNNGTISVDGSTPEKGTLSSATGQNSEIAIDNADSFAQAFSSQPTGQDEDQSCESIGGWAWAVCPMVGMISGAMNWLDTRIQAMLEIDMDKYANPELRAAWTNFRNLAYAVLIPIMLVMVIGTAINVDMFSAYTVKKALPRMVIAAIFISLSWHITMFLIGFFNVLGGGVIGLMTSPFGIGNNMSLETLFGVSSANAGDVASTAASASTQWVGTLGPLVGLTAFALSPGGLPILALYLLPAVLFILGAFLILMLREIFILAGILLAPLAILAWIFPGNDGMWKLWWNTFTKLLIMFPLIMVIIGAGRIAAHLIDISGGGGAQSLINPFLKLTAYILPYLFIPFAFKFAGGIFANLAGMVNDREKGLFDRIKKSRGEQMAEYGRRGGQNSIYDKGRAAETTGFKGKRMRMTNKVGGWIFDPVSSANIALGTEKGRSVISQVNQGVNEDTQKLTEVLSRMGFNAEELSALSVGRLGKRADGSKFWIRSWDGSGKDIDRIADQLGQSVDEQDIIGSRHLRANAPLLLQTTRSDEYSRASVRTATGLAYAAQGFATPEEIARLSNMADGYQYTPIVEHDNQGNVVGVQHRITHAPDTPTGLGGIIKTNAELLAARGGGLGKPGYGVRLGADGQYYATTTEVIRTEADGAQVFAGGKIEQVIRTGVQDLSGAKGSQISGQLGDAIEVILTAPTNAKFMQADGSAKNISEVRAGVEETLIQTMGSYAAPDVKRRIYSMLIESRATNYVTEGISVDEARTRAEQEVQATLRRSSGHVNHNELHAAEHAQQEEQNNEQH